MTNWLRASLIVGLTVGLAPFPVTAQPLEVEGQKFEQTVQVGGQTLNLNGVGLRKRAIFKVYVAGLYVPQKSTNAATLMTSGTVTKKPARKVRRNHDITATRDQPRPESPLRPRCDTRRTARIPIG